MKKNAFTKKLKWTGFDVEACMKRCTACVEIIDSDRPSLLASREHVCLQLVLTALTFLRQYLSVISAVFLWRDYFHLRASELGKS